VTREVGRHLLAYITCQRPPAFPSALLHHSSELLNMVLIQFYRPKPAPPGIFKDVPLPNSNANPFSSFVFHWVTPILKVGYSRPLEEDGM